MPLLLFKHSIFEDVSSLTKQVDLFHPHRNICAMRFRDPLTRYSDEFPAVDNRKIKSAMTTAKILPMGLLTQAETFLACSGTEPSTQVMTDALTSWFLVILLFFVGFCASFLRRTESSDDVKTMQEGDLHDFLLFS